MTSYIKSVLFGLIITFLLVPRTFAAEFKSGDTVVLPKDAVIEDNYFAAGESVTISGTVDGDLYVAGGTVNIEGTVSGDIFVAGGNIHIRGIVGEDVRVAGGEVVIAGNIEDDITVVGGSVTITDAAVIGGSLVAAGGSIQVFAPIPGSATFAAGNVEIGNSIEGDVLAAVGEMKLTPNGNLGGNLTYFSESEADVPEGATVSGQIKRQAPPERQREQVQEVKNNARSGYMTAKILNLLSAFVLGFLALHFFPRYVNHITTRIMGSPWQSMGIGFIFIMFSPIAIILFFMTIIGIPIGFLLLFAYFFYMYIAKIFISIVLGEKISNYFKWKNNNVAVLCIGLVVYLLLSSVPILGFFVVFISVITGVGAIILGKKDYYTELKTKKIV